MSIENKFFQEINLDGQWYYFGCTIKNPDGYEVTLDYYNIQSIELNDNILNWGHTAVLMYKSEQNVIERKPNPYEEPPPNEAEEKYVFRNDKRDLLLFHLEPAQHVDGNKFPDSHIIDITFVITDRKMLPSQDVNQQFTVLFLEEYDIQQMFERSIEWSTATANLNPYNNIEQTRMSDKQREMQTGLAIKDILEVTNRKWDPEYWDDGITREFYSSYGNASVGEIITYMLKHTLSSTYPFDICLFWKDRETQMWRLWPISKICEKAGNSPWLPGEWEVGHGFLQTRETDIDPKFFVPMAPQWKDEGDGERAIQMKNIAQWSFSDANIREADNLNASNITIAKNKRKMFYYDAYSIPENSDNYIKENYTAKKYVDGLHMAVTHNMSQNTLDNKRIEWSPHADEFGRRNESLMKQVWRRLMHSGCSMLTIKGSSAYAAGKFIGIQSKTYQETQFDYKQFGTWFIVECKHVLRGESYSVSLTCIKPESFREQDTSTDVT